MAISWITMGSGCGTTDLGAFEGVRDLKLDENFYFCHVQPEVITPQRCSPGAAGDGSGACHSTNPSMILADVETPTPCTNGKPNTPPTTDERSNYQTAQLRASRDVEASKLLGPDRAKGTCYVEVRLLRDGKKWGLTGWYNDEYAKVGEEWKFKSRKITVDSLGPVSEG